MSGLWEQLKQEVLIGDDRVINQQGNWSAMSTTELYNGVYQNADPRQAYDRADDWEKLGSAMDEHTDTLATALNTHTKGWTGGAADSARRAMWELVNWGRQASLTSTAMAKPMRKQGDILATARASMPEPVEADPDQMAAQAFNSGGMAGMVQGLTDAQPVMAKSQEAHQRAVDAMNTMEQSSHEVDSSVPQFIPPKPVAQGGPAATTPSVAPTAQSTPRTQAQQLHLAHAPAAGGGGAAPPQVGGGSGGSGGSGGTGNGGYVQPPAASGAGWGGSGGGTPGQSVAADAGQTSASSYEFPTPGNGGGTGPAGGLGMAPPPGDTVRSGSGPVGGFAGPDNVSFQRGISAALAPKSGAGGAGGSALRSALGGSSSEGGPGAGGRSGSAAGGRAGAVAEEGAPGAGGKGGAAGAPGAGGRGGKGEKDKEHKTKAYVQEADNVFAVPEADKLPPPVIGGTRKAKRPPAPNA